MDLYTNQVTAKGLMVILETLQMLYGCKTIEELYEILNEMDIEKGKILN